jgi:hypothetical protein
MHRNISDDFYMAIRPLLLFSRALGLAPLGYVRETLPGGTMSVQIVQRSPALAYGIFVFVLHLCLFAVSITYKSMYVFSKMSDTDIVTDILLHTTSITSLVSIVLSVTKNRNAIVRIMFLISEIDSIILPCSRDYYSKANTRLIIQLLVICILLGFIITRRGLVSCDHHAVQNKYQLKFHTHGAKIWQFNNCPCLSFWYCWFQNFRVTCCV